MRCFYNHDMCSVASNRTPWLDYDADIDQKQVQGFVFDIADTDVDTFLCCPTMLRQPLWPSRVMPHWQEEAPYINEPSLCHDWKYFEYVYFRLRRYMLQNGDPVGDTVAAAKQIGKRIFFSYRMNDPHRLDERPDSPHIDSFWRDHPELRIGNDELAPDSKSISGIEALLQNYLRPEVYDHYLSILEELTDMYDIDGLELDFMRAACFFAPSRLEEGTSTMTRFVRDVRAMLDRYGAERGKRLELSVTVPETMERAKKNGLDVASWDKEGLIDYVNLTGGFCLTDQLDLEGYRAEVHHAKILPVLNFALEPAPGKPFGNVINRIATSEQYRTVAHAFLERGADGLSFFNFTYTRHHHFNDPRRTMYPGIEPPFAALKGITDLAALRKEPKHYIWGRGCIQQKDSKLATLKFDLMDHCAGVHKSTLRLMTDQIVAGVALEVHLNGKKLSEFTDTGELFRPLSIEGLPINEQVRYYDVPMAWLQERDNQLEIRIVQPLLNRQIRFMTVELALYR